MELSCVVGTSRAGSPAHGSPEITPAPCWCTINRVRRRGPPPHRGGAERGPSQPKRALAGREAVKSEQLLLNILRCRHELKVVQSGQSRSHYDAARPCLLPGLHRLPLHVRLLPTPAESIAELDFYFRLRDRIDGRVSGWRGSQHRRLAAWRPPASQYPAPLHVISTSGLRRLRTCRLMSQGAIGRQATPRQPHWNVRH